MTGIQYLDDDGLLTYLRQGYVKVQPDLPAEFHRRIHKETEQVFVDGNPGNDILPKVPAMHRVLDDPAVVGALSTILGPGYMLHAHRHCHFNPPGSDDQASHQDSYEDDENVRHHHTRWAMAFYYPHDVTEDMGPTAVQPGTQYYYDRETVQEEPEDALCGPAGTVTIVHYDLWHRAMSNHSDHKRYMVKFLFVRRREPPPGFRQSVLDPAVVARQRHSGLIEHQWRWHTGGGSMSPPSSPTSLDELMEQLESGTAPERVDAAYALGRLGPEVVPPLVDQMKREARQRADDEDENPGQVNSLHALSAVGEPAVAALVASLDDADWPVRAAAADALADIGLRADLAVPALGRMLEDEADWVRRNAIDGLGTYGSSAKAVLPGLAAAMLDDSNGRVRHNAALAIARMGSAAEGVVQALGQALEAETPYVGLNAVLALKQIDISEAREILDTVPELTGGGRYASQ